MNKCRKLRLTKPKVNLNQCLKFNELLSLNCPVKSALRFSVKKYCRYDATKTVDGPPSMKKLKVHKSHSNPKVASGWKLTEPVMSNRYNLKQLHSLSRTNKQLRTYVEDQKKDIKTRAMTIEDRMKKVSGFYKELNEKYSFAKMKKQDLYNKLRKMNNKLSIKGVSKLLYKPNVNNLANRIYKNLGKSRKSYVQKENYQRMMQGLIKHNYELDFNRKYDKKMLSILKGDAIAIKTLNNSNYKFPISEKKLLGTHSMRKQGA